MSHRAECQLDPVGSTKLFKFYIIKLSPDVGFQDSEMSNDFFHTNLLTCFLMINISNLTCEVIYSIIRNLLWPEVGGKGPKRFMPY